jgi:geranylgeranyl pyrophosphate synthase
MKEKDLNKRVKEKKLMPQILKMLELQGGEALEQARKRLLAIGIENPKAQESLKMYANNWNDLIHPAILSLTSDSVSVRTPIVTDLQVLVLLLTAAMDIHDDVMDKSTIKYEKATLYGKFGEDLAILMGDALLMEAFMTLYSLRNKLDSALFDGIVATVKKSLLEVGNAHIMELQLKRSVNVLPQHLLNLIEKKAAIFEGIAEIGAIAGKGSCDQISALKASSRAFGYLVMIREEFIDMSEPNELSNRLKNEYPPLPILCAIEDPKIKELITKLSSGKITKKMTEDLVGLIDKHPNVIRLKSSLEDKAVQATEMLNAQNYLEKKPVFSLALLIKATLEDL